MSNRDNTVYTLEINSGYYAMMKNPIDFDGVFCL